jgi:membrane-associated phospholipid phosphatase
MLHGDGPAFPSGHTANATFTWIILVIVWLGPRGLRPDPARFRRWLAITCAWILVTSGLMVLLDYHWISDIPGGWALGALATPVAVAVLNAPPTRVANPSQHEC